ncbi:HAD domain-containing protein [Amycolatopsis sp. NPDC051758]|uniref:HAD domain-containing protein n=1 Tax=Amycolatopsis sp. NPDC051758 TaxID=3363935 RepID=UPI0037BBA055
MAHKGLLLLDVDGPLNPYAAKPNLRPPGYETFRRASGGGWFGGRDARRHKGLRVWLHPGHGALLRALAEDAELQLVWATTWLEEANTLIGPAIGLPDLPVIHYPPADLERDGDGHRWRTGGAWKWPTVAAYAAGRPLAWLDDDHADPRFAEARAAFEHERRSSPTLLCHVDPSTGLQTGHLDEIRTWAAALPAVR